MMQTSTSVGATARKVPSFPLLKVLPDRLQTLLQRRTDNDVRPLQTLTVEGLQTLQREALRTLTSRQPASRLGDYLDVGVRDRTSVRCAKKVLRELRLDDVRALALDTELTPALRQKHWLRKASVVRIGEASAPDVLRSIEPLLVDQAVIIFQHWNRHQEGFEEFLRAFPGITAQRLPSGPTVAQSFVVTRAPTV
jgi:hypothetical protein